MLKFNSWGLDDGIIWVGCCARDSRKNHGFEAWWEYQYLGEVYRVDEGWILWWEYGKNDKEIFPWLDGTSPRKAHGTQQTLKGLWEELQPAFYDRKVFSRS